MHKENLVYERLRPQEAIDIPLAEIDPKVSDDTFCVATQNWGQTFIHRFNCSPSLYLFHPYSAVRRAAIAFTTHFAYDIALTFVALGNLLELGIPQYMPPVFKRISILFYISEAVYQSLSRGVLFGTYTYLRNPWMCFDFIITLASLPHIEIVNPAKFQLQSLRGIRIFDVITIIPGVRMMGRGVMLSLNGITGVALLFLSFLTSVTIVAKHIFSGVFQNKCVLEPPKNLNISYSDFIYDRRNWLANGLCGNLTGSQKCPSGYICLPDIEDSSEHAHFDSFIPSCINSLAFITHDDWGDIFDQILKATGPLSSIFFVPVIFFGSFCLLNLMLIVVISTYEAMVSAYEAKYQKVSAYTYHTYFQFDISQLSLYPLPTNRETLRKVFRERDDLLSHREAVQQTWEMLKNLMNLSQSIQQKIEKKHAQNRVIFIPKSARNIQNERQTILNRWINFTEKVKAISESSPFRWFILLTVCINAIFLASEHANMSPKVGEILDIGNMVCIAIFSVEILIWLIAIGPHYFLSIWNLLDLTIVILGIMSISTLSLKHTTGFRLFKLMVF
ncbi:Sodium channel protein 1 brain like protein [Argiope bruennichi]|uniref:Sodium channel protein 1 brain like protein n=1 Tax=Argiope bruennichi TaxID=94029 RepID=A0A8T0E4I5_ARGBR|nr:Sodium channel protein 1 brain like protein [Argiope bruennichi]